MNFEVNINMKKILGSLKLTHKSEENLIKYDKIEVNINLNFFR